MIQEVLRQHCRTIWIITLVSLEIKCISKSATNTVLESHSFSYDKAGKITEERNVDSFTELNEVRSFNYDVLGRLTSSDIKDIEVIGNVSEENNKLLTTYTFDKVGNRLTRTDMVQLQTMYITD